MTATVVFGAGIPFTLARFMPELAAGSSPAEADRLPVFLRPYYAAFSLLPTALFIAYGLWLFANADPKTTDDSLNQPYLWLVIGFACAAQAWAEYTRAYLRGTQNFKALAIFALASFAVQALAITAGALSLGVHGAIIGFWFAQFIIVLAAPWQHSDKRQISSDIVKRVRRYASYRWASEITQTFIWARAEIFFLALWFDASAVGLFTVALSLANLAVQGPLMLTWGLLPRLSEQYAETGVASLGEAYATGTRLMAFIVLPACFGLAALIPEVLPLLYGVQFTDAVPAAIILVLGSCVGATGVVGANAMWAAEKVDVEFYLNLLGVLLTIAGGIFIIPAFGVVGAAVSRIIVQCTIIALAQLFMVRSLRFTFPLVHITRLLGAATVCGATAFAIISLNPSPLMLPLSIAAGAATYFITVRIFRGLTPADQARLEALVDQLPSPLSRLVGIMVKVLFSAPQSS
jgi:O-antigen/teichoic acid export membrane protein